MMYLLALVFAPISLTFNLMTIFCSPLIAILPAAFNWRTPPSPFWLFYTHDDDIYGSKTTKEDVPEGFFNRWKRSVWWLCRNPGYGFDAYVLGYSGDEVIENEVKYDTLNFDSGEFAFSFFYLHMTNNRTRFSLRDCLKSPNRK